MSEAKDVANALKAKPVGDGWKACCPCPGHGRGRGDKTPSLSIKEGDNGQLLLNCYGGCTWGDLISELDRRGIISPDSSRRDRARKALAYADPVPSKLEPDPDALWLWKDSVPLLNSPVQTYLERRGITERPSTLRCCYYHDDPVGFLAAVQRSDGKVIAVQVKMITRDGVKALGSRPDTKGHLGDGAVRLGPAAEIMGIAEGVETALSAMAMANIPVWASLGAQRLHSVALPNLVREVHIFVDNDGPGHKGAERAAEVHQRAGRRVVKRFPPSGVKDFNDLLLALADQDGSAAA